MGSFLSGVVASDEIVRMPVHVRGMGLAFECMLDLWGEQSSSGRSYTRCPTTDDHLIFLRGGTSWSWASSWSRVNIAESGNWSSCRLTFKSRLPEK